MPTGGSATAAASAIRTTTILGNGHIYTFRITLANDSVWHSLNEDGYYFPAATHAAPLEGDRAVESILITNREASGGITIEVGSWDHKAFQLAAPVGSRLAPGEFRIYGVQRLSQIALRNTGGGNVSVDVELSCLDR